MNCSCVTNSSSGIETFFSVLQLLLKMGSLLYTL
uniref:Uncharacterized protein MANES_15G173000 n=1 Tax=Rhizophora mucronata TaxID=61149 RepID=A0A2P2IXJ2_RHIMU